MPHRRHLQHQHGRLLEPRRRERNERATTATRARRRDTCQSGTCTGGTRSCARASDQCHTAGTCNTSTGACSNPVAGQRHVVQRRQRVHADGLPARAGPAPARTPSRARACDQCHTAGPATRGPARARTPSRRRDGVQRRQRVHADATRARAGPAPVGTPSRARRATSAITAGTCNPTTGACSNPVAADGTACNDGNACTQTDTCQGGHLHGLQPRHLRRQRSSATRGNVRSEAAARAPTRRPPNGTPCSDGNACTQTDACQSGACVGSSPVVCTASDACHQVGTCDPTAGTCSNPTAPDGTACSAGDVCTGGDTCSSGTCTQGPPVPIDDGNACTLDTCDPDQWGRTPRVLDD